MMTKLPILVSSVLAVITILIVAFASWDQPENLMTVYESGIRGALISGFLTLNGFLFSVYTFIIVKMKESVYDRPDYQKNVSDLQKIKPSLTIYGPLKNLSNLMFFTIIACFLTWALQLFLGLWHCYACVLFCLAMALFSMLLLLFCLLVIKQNLCVSFPNK